jgi:phage/plasmid primase-like uncharacterized protein
VGPDGLNADGKLIRIDVDGKKPGKKDGFYVYHSDGIPAGAYGDWSDTTGWQTWCACDRNELSAEEYAEHKRRLDAARAARSAAEVQRRRDAQELAIRIWDEANPCESHPYLTRKGVKSHGLREHSGRLVIPMLDRELVLRSLETIDTEGAKLFLAGGRKAGCWYGIGEPGNVLCVAEGYATGASVYEATGYYVAVAFDCGNMTSVAKALRDLHPTAKIVVCADDDQKTKGNPGTTAAAKAVKEASALMALPDLPSGGDFNDQHALKGAQSVADTIADVLAADFGPIDASDLFPMVMQEIQDRKSGKVKNALSTGIKSVDKLTRKLQRSSVIIVAGLPGAGKTAAALGIGIYNASHGIPVFMFSIEMDRFAIGVRCLSQNSDVPATDIFDEDVQLDRDTYSRLMSANGRMEKLLLTLDDSPVNIVQLIDRAHHWHATKVKASGHNIGLIIVDYLGLITSSEKSENRNLEVASTCKLLKVLARTLRVPLILCAQLNRASTKRGGEPELSDLRDSGEIEAVADLAIFPWPWPRDVVKNEQTGMLESKKRPMKADDKDDADVWIVKKNRNGPKGAVKVLWRPEVMQYASLTREQGQPDTRGDWQNGRGNE